MGETRWASALSSQQNLFPRFIMAELDVITLGLPEILIQYWLWVVLSPSLNAHVRPCLLDRWSES